MKRLQWIALPLALVLLACAYLGLKAKRSRENSPAVLTDAGICPERPNCVTSGQANGPAAIEPFLLAGDSNEIWPRIVATTREYYGGQAVSTTATGLHAEIRSPLFGFVDDLWLFPKTDLGRIDLRSQSRVGYSDLGKNRQHVEQLRAELERLGLVLSNPAP